MDIAPSVLDPVRGLPIKFDSNAEISVQIVQVTVAFTEDELCLTAGDGQMMRTLYVPYVVVLQIGVHALSDRR